MRGIDDRETRTETDGRAHKTGQRGRERTWKRREGVLEGCGQCERWSVFTVTEVENLSRVSESRVGSHHRASIRRASRCPHARSQREQSEQRARANAHARVRPQPLTHCLSRKRLTLLPLSLAHSASFVARASSFSFRFSDAPVPRLFLADAGNHARHLCRREQRLRSHARPRDQDAVGKGCAAHA